MLDVPWIARAAGKPHVAVRQLTGRQLGDQYGARVTKPFHDGGVGGWHLVLVRLRAPGRPDPFRGEEIFDAVGNAVERPLITSCADLAVGLLRLRTRTIFGERHNAVEHVAEFLQAREVQLRQLD